MWPRYAEAPVDLACLHVWAVSLVQLQASPFAGLPEVQGFC